MQSRFYRLFDSHSIGRVFERKFLKFEDISNGSEAFPVKLSLSKQLLIGFGAALTTVGLTMAWGSFRLIQTGLEKQVVEHAQSITQGLEFATEGPIEVGYTSMLQRVVENYATLPAVDEIAIVTPDYLTLAHSSQALNNSRYTALHPELALALEQAASSGVEDSLQMILDGKPVLAQLMPFSSVLFEMQGRRGLVIAILDLNRIRRKVWRTFWTTILTLLAGNVVILLVIGILIQRVVLGPLNRLHQAVISSKENGGFDPPAAMPTNEIGFLSTTFGFVFERRKQVEMALRDSEASERAKSQKLTQALKTLQTTQSQLVQAEKMSGLGQMVAGVAHEINNPVSFIYSNLRPAQAYFQDLLELIHLYQKTYPTPNPEIQALQQTMELDFLVEDLQKLLGSMQIGAERIREIVLSLRNFSRLDQSDLKSVDIHEGIDSTLLLLKHRLKARQGYSAIEVIREYGDLPLVECYPSQLNQVFMNILSNAIDALEKTRTNRPVQIKGVETAMIGDKHVLPNGSNRSAQSQINASVLPVYTAATLTPPPPLPPPCIRIRTEVLEGGDRGTSQDTRIAIRIEDNGSGIEEKIKSQLFNPFFTTKPVGKGTGLGLSISYQIVVDKHQGTLTCASTPSQGTEFSIEIPIHQQ
ncbi:MAG: ATP-binding protein [Leptolyngbyaceae cyanobacterium MO_188.B28]|nr:ATP-binding protein [Leptolyngbyaceae cyanobacterium MO_188.B28]